MKKIITLLCAICLVSLTLKAQNNISKIEVTGQAEIEVAPDYFEYSINLQEYLKTDNEKVSIEFLEKSLVKAVEEIGLKKDNLTINSVQGSKRYSSDDKLSSFLESRNYILKIKSINDINNLLPKLDKKGLTGTSLSKMTNKMQTEIEKELHIKAINDAKEKANNIAKSVGKKIGDILLISGDVFSGLRKSWKSYDLIEDMKVGYYGTFKTDIEVEKIKLSYQVNITFQMK